MNRKNKISTGKLLRSILLLVMMGWMGSAWAQTEQLLYSTDFTEWNDIDRKTTIGKTITQWTEFSNETLTFTLNGVGVDPNGTHPKFPNYTGYMITAKYPGEYSKSEPSVVTSQLKSITKIVLTQAATGGTRGIKVSVKGDGDADWVTIHNVSIVTAKGEVITLDAENRTNCQIKFENFTLNQNAYIVDLKIYGKATGTSNGIKMLTFEPQEGIIGKYPSKIKCDKDGKAVMPSGNTFSKPGYTFESWTDGTNDYTPGNSYNFTQDVTLKPKMRANSYHLYDNNDSATIVWNLDHSEAPALNIYSEHIQKNLSYTRPITVHIDGNKTETQDVALNINTKSGKIENTDERMNALTGKGALVKNGTQFTLPAMYGMKVTVKASDKVDAENGGLSTIFGTADNQVQIKLKDTANQDSLILKDAEVSTDGKTVTFTYKGDEPTITLTPYVNQGSTADNWFFESITATYPLLANFSYTNTISNPDQTNFPNEKVENACDTKVTLEDDTKSGHANTGGRYVTGEKLTITPTPKYGYDYTGIKIGETTYTASPYEYTILKGENKLEVIYTRKKLHKITLQSSEAELGTVNIEPKYDNFYSEQGKLGDITHIESWYTPETKVTMTAEAATNYIVDYWMDGKDRKDVGETYSFTTNDQDRTIIAHFKEGIMGNVKFVIPSNIRVNSKDEKGNFKNAISIKPDDMDNVRSFTIPTNYTLFKSIDDNGTAFDKYYTLKHWIKQGDTTKEYKLGNTYSFSTEGETITLVPVFEQNPATQDNRINNTVIRYDFARKVKEYEDPTSKETRKVCAQTVNIGKNQQVFWTSKVWVNVRESGKDNPHYRDVALWCDTGKKGYIRNEQFDNWCAFGPGTTFWFPSGTGTKVSLMSYAKITSTTIDDSVPTLDRERTNSERKKMGLPSLEEEENGAKSYMYVYTYTTKNPTLRPAIKIGEDYSYYQWLELSTLAANWVTLHTDTNDDSRGIISKDGIQPVITGESHERRELEDGGLAFHKGERIRITLNRKKGYELDKIVDLDKLDENGEPIAVLKMNDNGTVNMVGFDDGVLRKAEAYKPGYTHYLTSDSIRTQYELEFDITTHRNLQICFKEMKNTYYITYNAGDKAEGTSPEATWVEHGDQYVIPTNKTLYYEGNTLDHWVDGAGNKYEIGVAYKAPEKFIRMFPVFKPNEFNILNLTKEATATWKFAKSEGAPTINYEGTKGILVTQLETENPQKEGEKLSIDLKITLNGSKGKFNNVSNPERIQINPGSIVEFPTTKDCVAKWTATVSDKKLTIAGQTVTLTNNEASVTCSGETVIQKVEFNQGDGAYSKSFSVTYKPQNDTKSTIESLTCNGTTLNADQIQEMMNGTDKCITFTVSPWKNDNDTIPAVTGKATENGTVTVTKATVLLPECVATIKTQSGIVVETYPIKFKFETPTVAPTLDSLTVNGTTYTENTIELNNIPRSGVVKLNFNRPMKATSYQYEKVSSSTAIGKEQIIKYWDLPSEGTVTLKIIPTGDIYGGAYGQEITLTLHVAKDDTRYQRHNFNFIVGKDGNMDEAIKAANNNDKTDPRYYIFVPDGKYELTGNTTIKCSTDPKDAPKDEKGESRTDMNGKNNGKTEIRKSNISLIGQSKEGVKIWNHPVVEGISYTATIHLNKNTNDFYAQDLTLENQFNYWGAHDGSSGAGRAVAFCDQGNRSVLKNVALMSWQDTYYSDNSSPDYRGYFENCDLAGVVDWICGNGDIWFEKCNLIVRDRTGNNIAAPNTEAGQAWGYVFNNCTIRPETDKPTQLKGNDWTLARPWNNSPACTFLNTKMYTQPRTYGWNRMTSGLVVRFHEYNSLDDSNTPIPLGTRSLAACSPAPGSDDCILTDTTGYNIRNVMGGTDAFEPQILCRQIDALSGLQSKKDEENEDKEKVDTENHIIWDDNLVLNDDKLQWKDQKEALCYFLFKLNETGKWIYQTNVTENYIYLTQYGSGYYCVRAANQRGGLGSATKAIEYVLTDPYELEIKKVEGFKEGDVEYGWSTICLPFNAKVPEKVTAYAAIAHTAQNSQDETTKISDLTMTLTPVTVINANKGYVVYGPVDKHYFHPTSSESTAATILKGNPKYEAIPVENNKGYVLSYKSTWGIGFYKYTGSTLAANRAWLPKEMVTSSNQDNLALGKQNIHFVFAKGENTAIHNPITYQNDSEDDKYYNLSGQRVETPSKPGIYISKKKGKKIIR